MVQMTFILMNRHDIVIFIALSLAACLGFACGGDRPLTRDSLVGQWVGYFGTGVEVTRIHDDGTFEQVFYQNEKEVHRGTGKWNIASRDDFPDDRIVFADWVNPYEHFAGAAERAGTISYLQWDGRHPRVCIDAVEDYWIYKASSLSEMPFGKKVSIHVPENVRRDLEDFPF